ncbi:MAG: hypothetical protein ACM3TN_17375 [Alphaproteobacteria bacterium]
MYDYIVESKTGRKLNKQEIDSIAQAFLALARMDRQFEPYMAPQSDSARVSQNDQGGASPPLVLSG